MEHYVHRVKGALIGVLEAFLNVLKALLCVDTEPSTTAELTRQLYGDSFLVIQNLQERNRHLNQALRQEAQACLQLEEQIEQLLWEDYKPGEPP